LLEDLRRSAEGNRMSRLTLKAEPIEIDPDVEAVGAKDPAELIATMAAAGSAA